MKDELTHRLGCLTFNGLVGGLAILLLLIISALLSGGRMFSPGGLNAEPGQAALGGVSSHAEIKDCKTCHVPPWSGSSMTDQCLTCHTDLVQDPNNFHNLMLSQSQKTGCNGCHTEHSGPLAPLTVVDLKTFPHDQTGYALQAHYTMTDGSPFKCTDCHEHGYVGFDVVVCATCHTRLDAAFMQGHVATFGQDCLTCHDGKDTFGKNFDHQQVAFKLTGKHTAAGCSQCHLQAHTIAALKDTPQGCFACHAKEDAHKGLFGQDCSQCHVATGWKPATFDHSKSVFPLTGAHLKVTCTQCHAQSSSSAGLAKAPTACFACHAKDDAHQGQFGQDCSACHNTTAWQPPTFDHAKSAFPLNGAHAKVTCAHCHPQGFSAAGTPSTCFDCHAKDDAHKGVFGQDCAQCHTTAAWQPSTFDHSKFAFPLTGAHVNVTCTDCHTPTTSAAGLAATPATCNDCHAKDDTHRGQLGQDCSLCHSTAGWKPATFDHAKTAFPLTGTHTTVACTGCHTQGFSSAGLLAIPTTCYGCHAKDDAHQGQFGQDCSLCHTTSAWQPATFDHSKSAFPLVGAHLKVACTACHTQGFSAAGIAATPTTCYGCHAKDDPHQGQFGQDCAQCHKPNDWESSTFDHAKSAFPLVGAHLKVACTDCHTQGFSPAGIAATPTDCYSCHARDDTHQGQFGQDCSQCHTPKGWDTANFDHSNTIFPLTGGHLKVACSQCHLQGSNGTIYKGTPTACVDCHADPAYHLGMFGADCASCHNTTAYSPAKFNAPHTFPINHGEGGKNSCKACHPDNLTTYTCYTCHNQAQTVRRHEGETAGSIADCARCHPTGRGED